MKKLFNKKNISRILSFAMFGISFFVLFFFSHASVMAEGYKVLAPAPGFPETIVKDNGLPVYFRALITLIVGMALVFTVIMIVIGGFEYVSGKPASGKEKITQAITGLLILLFSYVLLQTINPDLLRVGFTVEPIGNIEGTGTNLSQSNKSNGGSTTGGNSLPCEGQDAAKSRINEGGTVCNNQGSCKTYTSNQYDSAIQASATKYGVKPESIRAVIARESGGDANPGSVDGKSCGLMQVLNSLGCSTDPSTNIDQGTQQLAKAYRSADQMISQNGYGKTVTRDEMAYAIYNGGTGQSTPSADCTTSNGWAAMPKWGCPVNPGSSKYNACFIRSNACGFGACI